MYKKAIAFLTKRIINLVIAIIVIGLLIYLGSKAYAMFKENNDIRKAESQLDKISLVVNIVKKSNEERKVDIYPPAGWYLTSFPDYDFPYSAECRTSKGCLCFCEDVDCLKKKKCIGFKFDVQVNEITRNWQLLGTSYVDLEGVLRLEEIEDLAVFKDEEVIKIKRAKK